MVFTVGGGGVLLVAEPEPPMQAVSTPDATRTMMGVFKRIRILAS
jgi:hypothetical protein